MRTAIVTITENYTRIFYSKEVFEAIKKVWAVADRDYTPIFGMIEPVNLRLDLTAEHSIPLHELSICANGDPLRYATVLITGHDHELILSDYGFCEERVADAVIYELTIEDTADPAWEVWVCIEPNRAEAA